MKKFITEILLVLLVVFILDVLVGYLGGILTQNEPISNTDIEKATLMDAGADIIILGSSRANHHYVSSIFEDNFHMKAYNAGRDGKDILYSYCALSSMMKRHIPKMVIIDLGSGQLDGSWKERFYSEMRFYDLVPAVKEITDEIIPAKDKWKLFVKSYRFNSQALSIINAYLSPTEMSDGYLPLEGVFDGDFNKQNLSENSNKLIISSYYISVLERIIELCEINQVDLFFVYSPCLVSNYQNIPQVLRHFSQSHNVVYYNYDDNQTYSSWDMYKDEYHMNNEGATVFTKELCAIINKYYDFDKKK